MHRRLIFAALLAGATACNIGYSDGARAGVVSKFSRKGFLCKTWEGELVMGGLRDVSHDKSGAVELMGNVWPFTVRDENVARDVTAALESGARVRLNYKQVVGANPCSTDTGYFVTSVETPK